MNQNRETIGTDIEAVITSFNQGRMIVEAVESLCTQTLLPQKIIIVDDGSTDEFSIRVLKDIEKMSDLPVPVMIYYQEIEEYPLREIPVLKKRRRQWYWYWMGMINWNLNMRRA